MIYKKRKERKTHQFSMFLIKNLIFKSKTAIEKNTKTYEHIQQDLSFLTQQNWD